MGQKSAKPKILESFRSALDYFQKENLESHEIAIAEEINLQYSIDIEKLITDRGLKYSTSITKDGVVVYSLKR
jgi:hypothetical protein